MHTAVRTCSRQTVFVRIFLIRIRSAVDCTHLRATAQGRSGVLASTGVEAQGRDGALAATAAEAQRQRQCLSLDSSGGHTAKAVPQPQREREHCASQGKGGACSRGGVCAAPTGRTRRRRSGARTARPPAHTAPTHPPPRGDSRRLMRPRPEAENDSRRWMRSTVHSRRGTGRRWCVCHGVGPRLMWPSQHVPRR